MVRHVWKPVLAVAVLGGAFVVATRWPGINDVETGRTPEYPDLRVREYLAGEKEVAKAARATVLRLSRWSFLGEGKGPRGVEIQAAARTRVLRFTDDVTIRIWREGARTRVSVRSRSRIGKWDFGQNARNIHEFLGEMDRQMFAP